jgi:type I restriction enzyme M protein
VLDVSQAQMSVAVTAITGGNQPKVAIIVQQGKVLDFIDGLTQRSETLEEHVRQEIAKSLVREYRYSKTHISVEFPIQMGTRKPRADLVIFMPDKPHAQENARIIVECKAPTIKMGDKDNGVGQLKSYLDACPNAIFGMWINGVERICYRRVEKGGKRYWEEVCAGTRGARSRLSQGTVPGGGADRTAGRNRYGPCGDAQLYQRNRGI